MKHWRDDAWGRRLLMTGLAVALAGPACLPPGEDLDGGIPARDGPNLMADSAGDSNAGILPLREYAEAGDDALEAGALGTRWIAVARDAAGGEFDCNPDGFEALPRPGGTFRVRHLIEGDAGGQPAAAIAAVMRRYCVIDWEPENADQPVLPSVRDLDALRQELAERYDEFAQDLLAPGPQADPLEEEVWRPMALGWRASLDELRPLPRPATPLDPVRIAVADTSPFSDDGEANDGRSEHGLAMGRIAKVLSCPPGMGPCPGYVTHHLALPRVSATVRPADGGFFGYQSEVAIAIESAVRKWRQAPPEEGGQHLVINLSLGWDGRHGGPMVAGPADLRPGVRAVYAALAVASCHGALVIASAGNRSGGPDEAGNRGPLFPAGWETRAAPTAQQCREIYGIEEPVVSEAAYRPLVYAVGGVRPDDQPLGNTRPGGRPSLAVPAFQAVVGVDDGTGTYVSSGLHTGTSVAAAALSGIAAALWAYRPDLDAHALMEQIYRSGVNLSPDPDGDPVQADFCALAACPAVHRVSMCLAYKQICAGGEGRCNGAAATALACATPPAYGGSLDVLAPYVAAMQTFVRT
ncbi:MAG: S8/S53 family peptidase, partial [bacterium]